MSIISKSGWSYAGSAGASASGGEILEISAGQVRLLVSDPEGNKYKIIGTGMGIGIGVSLSPVTLSESDWSYPSAGSNIYGFAPTLEIDDLSGILSVGAASAVGGPTGGSGSVGVFLNASTYAKIAIAASVLNSVAAAALSTTFSTLPTAICFFAGLQLNTLQLGADVNWTHYIIHSADMIDSGAMA